MKPDPERLNVIQCRPGVHLRQESCPSPPMIIPAFDVVQATHTRGSYNAACRPDL